WFPELGHDVPVALYLGGVMLAAWYGGAGPGLVATGLSLAAGSYWFAAPYGSFHVERSDDLVRIAFGALEGATISVLVGALHRQTLRAQRGDEELERTGGELRHEADARAKAESSLQRTTEQLLLAQRMHTIGALAAGVAHDLNNLLTVVINNATLALRRATPDAPDRPHLEGIRDASGRAVDLTRKVLSFARGKGDEPCVLDLVATVRDLERVLRDVAGGQVEVATKLDDAPALVRADPTQLEQLLTNLVVNARDAMPRGGTVTIEVAQVELDANGAGVEGASPGPYVRLTVADTGTGMPADVRERIFEPFFTTKDAGRGSGLGLLVVRGVVERTGGAIRVDSAPGAGTTFTVHLPRTPG
ncbi:MAG: ATP-binding protein, partial [Polyangiaceae bacterium]